MSEMIQVDQGYCVLENVFERAEMLRAIETLVAGAPRRSRAGARHLLGVPVIRDLASDPRMLDIAREFVGRMAMPFRATLFDKSPTANWLVVWHQDTALPLRERVEHADWGPWSTKAGILYAHAPGWALEQIVALRISLDDSSMANGPLRVLPGTHRGGVYTDEEIERLARSTAPIDCVTPSGGVVAMRPLTIHASSKSSDARPRRVLHMEYAATMSLGSGIELAVA